MQQAPLRSRGMTLIEVLVGIVIGMVAMIAIFQVVTVWDARSKASSASGDSQIAGSLAMFNLERDVKLGGMGFGEAGPSLNCTVNAYDNIPAGRRDFSLRPVSITFNGAAGPDQIDVLYGNSPFLENGLAFSNGTATSAQTDSKYGLKQGDIVVLTDGGSACNLAEVTDTSGPDDYVVNFTTAAYVDFYASSPHSGPRWNNASSGLVPIGSGTLFSLGPLPRRNVWTVNRPTGSSTGTLGFFSNMSTINVGQFFGMAEGVVDMKVVYGYDANNDKRIDDSEWIATQPADWTRLRAIRVALLVRGREFVRPKPTGASDTPDYTAAVPTWSQTAINPFSTMTNLDGTADSNVAGDPNNWRYYRYRVYERVIPLRNVIWGA